ncbi:LRR receptor-like kinase [Medicago truncatula]|uniref:LRR receptor-like kinase n=1 Tax=Medicago truncatula TaxID=3880 RepID=G7KCP5_MEDTR|nr:LRR receptor-like kinase [Medicago truncatula]
MSNSFKSTKIVPTISDNYKVKLNIFALLQFKNLLLVNGISSQHDIWPSCSSFSLKTDSWKNNTDCCEWYGVMCDTVLDHVIGLDLRCNNLKGELHLNSTIFKLKHLQRLNCDLVNLTHLNLSNTGIICNIPSTISHLSKLVSLDLMTFPLYLIVKLPMFNWSTPLRYLDLSLTFFSGEIPYSIGQLKSLNQLSLKACDLHGLIPQSLWNLTQLTHLDLSFNKLNGEIPSLLSNLAHLTYLDLEQNAFTGLILNMFHKLIKLEYLDISSNNITGQIPSSLFHLAQLSYLDLSFNKLVELYLSDNHLRGSIGEFSTYSLQKLLLSNNKLHGHFPNSIFKFQNLTYLGLSSTNLNGDVDFHQFSNFEKLTFLDLSRNNFLSVNIGSSVDSISPNLESLYLSSSNINSFPNFFAQLQNLQELDLSNNIIQGKVPKWFHEKRSSNSTHSILFTHNNLTGMIPQCLGTFPSLSILDMQMNNLYGSFPRTFSKGNTFEMIKLNGNQLEGPLPQSLDTFPNWLETLQELQVLSLRSNNLHGAITCSSTKHTFPKLRIFYV